MTLGERTPVPEQRAIYDAVKDTRITLTLAAIDHRGYAFRREGIKMAVPASESKSVDLAAHGSHLQPPEDTIR